ncbi:MAG: hypothetical protein K2W82_15025 [Candidatus Obscuribacterales bacterium]|nr:hypothetical protein [Candidatus Obscuribacterales bacterium]
MPDNVPELQITDQSLEPGWHWQDGWNGLIPSMSSLADVCALLQEEPGSAEELANGTAYSFLAGGVVVVVLSGDQFITALTLRPHKLPSDMVPATMADANKAFGKFMITDVKRREGTIHQRPGMKVCAQAGPEQAELQKILWLEIFRP